MHVLYADFQERPHSSFAGTTTCFGSAGLALIVEVLAPFTTQHSNQRHSFGNLAAALGHNSIKQDQSDSNSKVATIPVLKFESLTAELAVVLTCIARCTTS